MPDFGITETGFNRKRLDVILEELNNEVRAILGENANLSPESPDGQINGVLSESFANLWEIGQAAYNSFNPSAATGAALSNLVQLNGITRLAASASFVDLFLTGTPGAFIPAGSLVSGAGVPVFFQTVTDVTLDGSGEGVTEAIAQQTGPIIANAGTLVNIETPITGWLTVTNPDNATIGRNEETDLELRARRQKSTAAASQSIIDSIFANVADLPGVVQVAVIENDTDATVDSQPPHSFHTVVLGGDNQDIANEIFLRKPAGIQAFGSITEVVNDIQGFPHNISFSRPVEIPIFVIVNTSVGTMYPSNGDDLIKQNIVDYSNGNLVEGQGFFLGDDVIQSRLYTPANRVPNHDVMEILIGTGSPPTLEDNITIGNDELAVFTVDNIEVNHV
jgi:uncharacterized phage protein gp47/JayE